MSSRGRGRGRGRGQKRSRQQAFNDSTVAPNKQRRVTQRGGRSRGRGRGRGSRGRGSPKSVQQTSAGNRQVQMGDTEFKVTRKVSDIPTTPVEAIQDLRRKALQTMRTQSNQNSPTTTQPPPGMPTQASPRQSKMQTLLDVRKRIQQSITAEQQKPPTATVTATVTATPTAIAIVVPPTPTVTPIVAPPPIPKRSPIIQSAVPKPAAAPPPPLIIPNQSLLFPTLASVPASLRASVSTSANLSIIASKPDSIVSSIAPSVEMATEECSAVLSTAPSVAPHPSIDTAPEKKKEKSAIETQFEAFSYLGQYALATTDKLNSRMGYFREIKSFLAMAQFSVDDCRDDSALFVDWDDDAQWDGDILDVAQQFTAVNELFEKYGIDWSKEKSTAEKVMLKIDGVDRNRDVPTADEIILRSDV